MAQPTDRTSSGPRVLDAAGVTSLVGTRSEERLGPDEVVELLRERLGDQVLDTVMEYDTHTVVLDDEGYAAAAQLCRDDDRLAFDLFDCLFGVDAREAGFDVVTVLYSTQLGVRLLLQTRCEGGRENPTCPTLTHLYRGAGWMERETWDMFGIEFDGHPGLAPRILTAENFDGWPLRKDFFLASREAKPWPGVKEPAELDDEGNVIERVPGPGDAPGPTELDKAMAEQAKLANPAPEVAQTAEGATADEPETGEGTSVASEAETASVADDSGQVVAGEQEEASEAAEEHMGEAKVADGEASEADEAAAGREHAEDTTEASASERRDEAAAPTGGTDDAEAARQRAESQRKAAAEARAEKAAERTAAAERDAGDVEANEGDAEDEGDGGAGESR